MSSDARLAVRALGALALANARYWPGVTPLVRAQLRHWGRRARTIEDPQLRELALGKLHAEGFNAEAAAIAATLAPQPYRAQAVQAIVALELLFDYLDGLTERPHEDPLGEGERLYAAFTGAIDPCAAVTNEGYLHELAGAVQSAIAQLPASEAVAQAARRSAERGAQAQTRMHAAPTLGRTQLAEWARAEAATSGLGWREHLAGSASSVLALHALIAAAADGGTTTTQAEQLEAAYLAIGAVVTLLDGLVDHARDTHAGQLSYAALYDDPRLLAQALTDVINEAAARCAALPDPAHHLMTLAGAIAYWSSAPDAGNELARPVLARLRGDLRMLVLPPMLVMRAWRSAKWARHRWHKIAARGA